MGTVINQKVSISKFFANENTSNFLQQQLGAKKSEFVSNVIAITDADASLQQCEPAELMKCAMNATALNLPLNKNLGYAYVIAYNSRQKDGSYKMIPQFQMGYKGFIQLAIRSGQYKTINTCEVREGEIKRNKFTGHTEFLGENPEGEIVGYLAYIELMNGFQQSLYMTEEQVRAHAKKYSKNFDKYGTGLWREEFDLMAKKTVLKLLLNRYGVLSVEMQKAIINDQADSNGDYIDNPKGSGSSGRAVVDATIVTQDEPEAEPEQKEVVTRTLNFNEI